MSRIKPLFGAALALLLAGCTAGSQTGLEPFQPPAQVNYDTCSVTRGGFQTSFTVTGTVVNPEITGFSTDRDSLRIAEFPVAVNQEVKKGDLLMRLENEDSSAKLLELTQGLEALKREYALKKARLEREIRDAKGDLKHESYYSHELKLKNLSLQKLESEYGQYQFETERAILLQEKAVEKQKDRSGDVEWTAPFDGKIAAVTELRAGDLAPKNTVLIQLASYDRYLVAVDNSAAGFRYQMPVTLEAGRPDERAAYTGHVVSAYSLLPSRLDLKKQAFIQLEEPLPEAELKLNLKVTGEVVTLSNVLTADRPAMRMSEGKNWVTILNGDMLQKRRVLVGQFDSSQFVILDGLEEGQRLLLD